MKPSGILKSLIPPLLLDSIPIGRSYRFRGNFRSWKEASAQAKGYSASGILEKVKEASLLVKDGRAAFERDSVAFTEIEYPWELLSALLWIASMNGGRLSVLDFGGSLGSTYFQCRKFLDALEEVHWSVVEQPHFVECGREYFETGTLKFHEDLQSSFRVRKPDVVLFGSVLQYLEDPFAHLENVFRIGPPFIIVDRTPFLDGPRDRLCLQEISRKIYPASYPAWFFSRSKFMNFLSGPYRLWEEYPCPEDKGAFSAHFLGMIFKKADPS